MKLVIDILKQDYIYIAKKHCLPSCDDRTLRKYIYEMITNGTPLPEGHGRIIDESKINECEQAGLIMKNGSIVRCFVTDAPTIIEGR